MRRYNERDTIYSEDVAKKIAVDNSGNVYVSGWAAFINAGGYHFSAIKYSGAGLLIWTISDTSRLAGEIATMAIDSNSNIYLSGPGAGMGYRTIKYDSSGTEQWNILYQTIDGEPWDIKADRNSNIFVTGQGGGKMLTIKYSQPVGIKTISSEIPRKYKLFQNYPNPFNPLTNIGFRISDL